MTSALFYLTTALLMMLLLNCGLQLIPPETMRGRRVPLAAVGLTGLAIAGIIVQVSWSAAMDALDSDPSKSGWWRMFTSIFMQNGGVLGDAFNVITLAAIATLVCWYWNGPLMLTLFLVGALVPHYLDMLFGKTSVSTDPRNFAGSSGATYFLAATLAAALLFHRGNAARQRMEKLLALSVPAVGIVLWFTQDNAHGLVAVYGFVLGLVVVGLRAAFGIRQDAPAETQLSAQP